MTGKGPLGELSFMVVSLVATNALIWTLLGLKVRNWHSHTITPTWVIEQRSTIAIAVQVIAQLLGMAVIAVLSTIINLGTRSKLTYGTFSLESLNFLNALCALRPDWTLKKRRLLFLLLFIASSFAPAALWAGAITPLISSVQNSGLITIPKYTNVVGGIIDQTGIGSETLMNITTRGTFTYRPELLLQGLILDNVRSASSLDGGPTSQSKMDNTNYRYIGRSYGVGSSVGLKTPFVDSTVQSYKYVENGFRVSTNCSYNENSTSGFQDLTPVGFSLKVYNGVFEYPDIDVEWIIASAGQLDYQILVLNGAAGPKLGTENITHYAMLMSPAGSAGRSFGRLHDIQCELKYAPTNFEVSVNATNNTIAVNPVGPADEKVFTNYTEMTKSITHRLYNIGQLFASTQWGSPMGDAFMNNVNNLAFARNETSIRNETVIEAVEASMESMLDSIMEALSGAQMMVLGDSTDVRVTLMSQGVVFGDKVYIYAIVVIDALLTFIFLVEFVRTRMWKNAPKFDYMSVLDLVLATSAGGAGISKEAHQQSLSESVGDIRIMLVEGSDGNDVLVTAHSGDDHEEDGVRDRSGTGSSFKMRTRSGYEQI